MITREELNRIFEEVINNSRDVMFSKNREYSRDTNALDNFDTSSEEAGITPLQAWAVFFRKHLNSILTYVREGKSYSNEDISERITDCINYLVILQALIIREKELNNKEPDNIRKNQVLLEKGIDNGSGK